MIKDGEKCLVSCDKRIMMPDGKEYRYIYGECQTHVISDFFRETAWPNSEWFVKIGKVGGNNVVIAGKNIQSIVSCPDRPNYEFLFENNQIFYAD